jgi:steroid 5-alpha reductase family enzyme
VDVLALGSLVLAVTAVAAAVITFLQAWLISRQTRFSVVVESFWEAYAGVVGGPRLDR